MSLIRVKQEPDSGNGSGSGSYGQNSRENALAQFQAQMRQEIEDKKTAIKLQQTEDKQSKAVVVAKSKPERTRAQKQELVDVLAVTFKSVVNPRTKQIDTNAYTVERLIRESMRWMATRYRPKTWIPWMNTNKAFAELQGQNRLSDAIHLNSDFFLFALEEIMLTSQSRDAFEPFIRYWAAFAAYTHIRKALKEIEKDLNERPDLNSLPAEQSTETLALMAQQTILQQKQETEKRLFEEATEGLRDLPEEKGKRLKKKPQKDTDFAPNYSPELLLLLDTVIAEESKNKEQKELWDQLDLDQKKYIATARMDTLAKAFMRFQKTRPFAALIHTMQRAARGAVSKLDYRFVQTNTSGLQFRSTNLHSLVQDAQSKVKDLAKAEAQNEQLEADYEKKETEVKAKPTSKNKAELDKLEEQLEASKREVTNGRTKLTKANNAVSEAYDEALSGAEDERIRSKYGTGLRLYQLWFRGKTGVDTNGDVPVAISNEFNDKFAAAFLDTTVAEEISTPSTDVYNTYVNADFVVFFRLLSETGRFPLLAMYVQFAQKWTKEVFEGDTDAQRGIANMLLAQILQQPGDQLKWKSVLLLTALWCKFTIWRSIRIPSNQVVQQDVQLVGQWLDEMKYPQDAGSYFAVGLNPPFVTQDNVPKIVKSVINALGLDKRTVSNDEIKAANAQEILSIASTLGKKKPTWLQADQHQRIIRSSREFVLDPELDFKKLPTASPTVDEDLKLTYNLQVSTAAAIARIVPALDSKSQQPIPNAWLYPDGTIRHTFARPPDDAVEAMEFDVVRGLTDSEYVRDALIPRATVMDNNNQPAEDETVDFEDVGKSDYEDILAELADECSAIFGPESKSAIPGHILALKNAVASTTGQQTRTPFRFHPDRVFWDVYFPLHPSLKFNPNASPQIARALLARYASTMQVTCHITTASGDHFVVTDPDIQWRMQQMMWINFVLPPEPKPMLTDTQRQNAIKADINKHSSSIRVNLTPATIEELNDIIVLAGQAAAVTGSDGVTYDWRYHNYEFVARAWMYRYAYRLMHPSEDTAPLFEIGWQRWDNEFKKLLLRGELAKGIDEKQFLEDIKREEKGVEGLDEQQTLSEEDKKDQGGEFVNKKGDWEKDKDGTLQYHGLESHVPFAYTLDTKDDAKQTENKLQWRMIEVAARRFRHTARESLNSSNNDSTLRLSKAAKSQQVQKAFFLPPMPMQTSVGKLMDSINSANIVKAALAFETTDSNFEEDRAQRLEQYNFRMRRVADRWCHLETTQETGSSESLQRLMIDAMPQITRTDLETRPPQARKVASKAKAKAKGKVVEDLPLLELVTEKEQKEPSGKDEKKEETPDTKLDPDELLIQRHITVIRALSRVAVILQVASNQLTGSIISRDTEINGPGIVDFGLSIRDFARALHSRMLNPRTGLRVKLNDMQPKLSSEEEEACTFVATRCLVPMIMEQSRTSLKPGAMRDVVAKSFPGDTALSMSLRRAIFEELNVFLWVVWFSEIMGRSRWLEDDEEDDRATSLITTEASKAGITKMAGSRTRRYKSDTKVVLQTKLNQVTQDLTEIIQDTEEDYKDYLHLLKPVTQPTPPYEMNISKTLDERWQRLAKRVTKTNELTWVRQDKEKKKAELLDQLEGVVDSATLFLIRAEENKTDGPWLVDNEFPVDLIIASLPKVAQSYFLLRQSNRQTDDEAKHDMSTIWRDTVARMFASGSPTASPDMLKLIQYYSTQLFYLLGYGERVFAYLNDVSIPAFPTKYLTDIKTEFDASQKQERKQRREIQKKIKKRDKKERQQDLEEEAQEETKDDEYNIESEDQGQSSDFALGEIDLDAYDETSLNEEVSADRFIGRINDGSGRRSDQSDVFGVWLAMLHLATRLDASLASEIKRPPAVTALRAMFQPERLVEIQLFVQGNWISDTEVPLTTRVPARVTALQEIRKRVMEHASLCMNAETAWREESKAYAFEINSSSEGKDEKKELTEDEKRIRGMRGDAPTFAEEPMESDAPIRELMSRFKRFFARLHKDPNDELFALISLEYYMYLLDKLLEYYFPEVDSPGKIAMRICKYGHEDYSTTANIAYLNAIKDGGQVFAIVGTDQDQTNVSVMPLTNVLRRVLDDTLDRLIQTTGRRRALISGQSEVDQQISATIAQEREKEKKIEKQKRKRKKEEKEAKVEEEASKAEKKSRQKSPEKQIEKPKSKRKRQSSPEKDTSLVVRIKVDKVKTEPQVKLEPDVQVKVEPIEAETKPKKPKKEKTPAQLAREFVFR